MSAIKTAAKKPERPPAKSIAERQDAWRKRQAAIGRKELRGLYAHVEDHPSIREAAARINRRRERAGKRAA